MSTSGRKPDGRGLMPSRAWVLVKGTSVVGRALKLHAAGASRSVAVSSSCVGLSVLELLGGHAFVAQEGQRMQLRRDRRARPSHATRAMLQSLGRVLAESMTMGESLGVGKELAPVLVRSALEEVRRMASRGAPLEQA